MQVKVSVTQKIDGEEYSGNVDLGKSVLGVNLKFGVPISQLDDQRAPEEANAKMAYFKKLFQFSVTKNKEGEEVKIENFEKEVFGFLVGTVGRAAIEFYNNPQTKDSNQGFLGKLAQGRLANIGMEASLSMSLTYTISDESIPEILL